MLVENYSIPLMAPIPPRSHLVLRSATRSRRAETPIPQPDRVSITSSLRSKIRGLRTHASWSFRRIAREVGVAVSTVFSICKAPSTPTKVKPGRPKILSTPIRKRLIEIATSSQQNRRLPYSEVAALAGITAGPHQLRAAFASEGYHRRVARARPYLSQDIKDKRLDWAWHYADWTWTDWNKVIWSDEAAFNVGGLSSSGRTWVTRMPGEEDIEDCLVPVFPKLQTVLVWACFKGGIKGPLIIWDKENWGTTVKSHSFTQHIVPSFHEFWQQQSQLQLDYVYLMQDNASPHTAGHTQSRFKELGIWGYFIDWPPSSPDCNPIENVWRLMKQRIRQRTPFPTTNEALRIAIHEEWDAITSEELSSLVNSLPTRVREVCILIYSTSTRVQVLSTHYFTSDRTPATTTLLIIFFIPHLVSSPLNP